MLTILLNNTHKFVLFMIVISISFLIFNMVFILKLNEFDNFENFYKKIKIKNSNSKIYAVDNHKVFETQESIYFGFNQNVNYFSFIITNRKNLNVIYENHHDEIDPKDQYFLICKTININISYYCTVKYPMKLIAHRVDKLDIFNLDSLPKGNQLYISNIRLNNE